MATLKDSGAKPQSLAIMRSASAGSVIKKMVEINPELGVQEIASMIRAATTVRGSIGYEYMDVEVIDQDLALKLARESLLISR